MVHLHLCYAVSYLVKIVNIFRYQLRMQCSVNKHGRSTFTYLATHARQEATWNNSPHEGALDTQLSVLCVLGGSSD